jgi:AcrR family transcriptional regulator
MARRTLENLEKKILGCTANLGAKKGIENISTAEIAKICDISEPTIFVHFKKKNNLIAQVGRHLDEGIKGLVSEACLDVKDKDMIASELHRIWLKCFDFLIAHPDQTRYYIRYKHSAYYDPKYYSGKDSAYEAVKTILLSYNEKLAAYSEIGYEAVSISVIDATLSYAKSIIEGRIKNSPEIKDKIFKIVFSIVL